MRKKFKSEKPIFKVRLTENVNRNLAGDPLIERLTFDLNLNVGVRVRATIVRGIKWKRSFYLK